MKPLSMADRLTGVVLGTAVGDALGLPAENLSPGRIRRLWSGEWRMRFLGRWGMISDDTEHTLLVGQSLLTHPIDPIAFQRSLAWKLRWWFAGLPAGVGLATARACLKLWIGFPPNASAVNSAGSGPAMRSAIIGAFFAQNESQRRSFVSASSRLTHSGWQAEVAAQAVAECVALAVRTQGQPRVAEVITTLGALSNEQEWVQQLAKIEAALASDLPVAGFASALGLTGGVSGYSLHVVPVALYAWLRHPGNFRETLVRALECGGDTDTVGAVAGALAGAVVGEAGIPAEWTNNLREWPRSVSFMRRLAQRLATQGELARPLGPHRYFWPGVLSRNVMFLLIVLMHGLRRVFPPY